MPRSSAVAERLSEMLVKQESLLSELHQLAQQHGIGDRGGGGDEETTSPLMTWVRTLAALEDARESIDDLITSVDPAAAAAVE